MTRTTLRRALASLAMLLVALTGCSGDPEPRMADPSPTSPSVKPSEDEGVDPPDLPSKATVNDSDGAEAFTRYYWALAEYAQVSGRVKPIESISADTCSGCAGAAAFVRGIYEAGGSIQGVNVTVVQTSAERISADPDNDYAVEFTIRNSPQTIVTPGKQDRQLEGGLSDGSLVLNWIDDAFRVDVVEIS